MTGKIFSVWEGVYQSFQEAAGDLDAFSSDMWIGKQSSKAELFLNNFSQGKTYSRDYPLAIVVAMCLKNKDLSILDFGGGMGEQYIDILSKVPNSKNKIFYHIIESQKLIDNLPNQLGSVNQIYRSHINTELKTTNPI